MFTLETSVTNLFPQIATRVQKQLTHLGIHTVRDLLFYFPFRHEDYRIITPLGGLSEVAEGTRACVSGRVDLIRTFRSPKRHMIITEGLISDESGSAKVMWFHQPYIAKALPIGSRAFFIGRVSGGRTKEFLNPAFEKGEAGASLARDAGHIVPVYRTTEGLTQRMLRAMVRRALPVAASLREFQPPGVIRTHELPGFSKAIASIHFPSDERFLGAAKMRLAFDELFLFQARAFAAASQWKKQRAPVVVFDEPATKGYVKALPFRLTDAQRKAAWQILGDISKEHPMNRLLHGDVGSGKTVTASIAMFNVARAGLQAALLCPTEILAQQHFETLRKFFRSKEVLDKLEQYGSTSSPHILSTTGGSSRGGRESRSTDNTDIPIALLTAHSVRLGSRRVLKSTVLKRLGSGQLPIVVGTHALLQPPVIMPRLALAIIDEQHRFGVEQRKQLVERRSAEVSLRPRSERNLIRDDMVPHILTMTATPIPRTLALTLYSDMDLSVLNTMPTRRAGVATRVLRADERERAEEHVRKEIAAGHGIFVLCPRIEVEQEGGETLFDWEGTRSVKAESERLAFVFPQARIGALHGKMSSEKKSAVMEAFRSGDVDILVTTSVVEVGIDVPRATVMLIENAEVFGLAQLHQLRGRVGRSELPGVCYLLVGTAETAALERVRALEELTDGFALAERDLILRGPSPLWGDEQSGWPKFRIADVRDKTMVERTHEAVKKLFREDPTLARWPGLQAIVGR